MWSTPRGGERFIELAGEINTGMRDYVVGKVMLALNENNKTVKGAKILICGLAYKADVDDDRESPSYRLMEKLEALGATVSYNDPYIPVICPSREYAGTPAENPWTSVESVISCLSQRPMMNTRTSISVHSASPSSIRGTSFPGVVKGCTQPKWTFQNQRAVIRIGEE